MLTNRVCGVYENGEFVRLSSLGMSNRGSLIAPYNCDLMDGGLYSIELKHEFDFMRISKGHFLKIESIRLIAEKPSVPDYKTLKRLGLIK